MEIPVLTLTPEELVAIKLSLRVALVATAASLPIGILIALLLARGRFTREEITEVMERWFSSRSCCRPSSPGMCFF